MEKLNITKFLKDCPQGMKLNCVILDNLYFDKISEDEHSKYPIFCFTIDENGNRNSISFTKDGCVTTRYGSKCVIFPEGKTTWDGFQRPFKDGDIVFYNDTIAIFKEWGDETLFRTYVTKYLCCDFMIDKNVPLFGKSIRKEIRFATEEEKELLFNAIKDNRYRWNDATKTLEKLIEPKFKVGDEIVRRNSAVRFTGRNSWIVVSINSNFYEIKLSKGIGNIGVIPISEQDDWELVPNKFDISTLVPFESKVLVRDVDHHEWEGAIFGRYDGKKFFTIGGLDWGCCIPYEDNEHLFGTTDDCDDYYKVWKS